MAVPMLVVHGVATRDPSKFKESVTDLQRKLGDKWNLIPAYWGDLGGQAENLPDTLFDMSSEVRSAGITPNWTEIAAVLGNGSNHPVIRSEDTQIRPILQGLGVGQQGNAVRSDQNEGVANAIRQELPNTKILKFVTQQDVLVGVGRVLGASLRETPETATTAPFATRASEDNDPFGVRSETRGFATDIASTSKAVLRELDDLLGKVVDNVLGKTNQDLRRFFGTGFVSFFGDVFAYQGGRDKFHQRLRDVINQHAPGWGTQTKPISVLAHSLGGVLSFDAAVMGQPPLWIDNFVTFGSQSSFFQVVDPRSGLNRYTAGNPVLLPENIVRWRNLWEPIDFLAFNAGRVFRLHSGESPQDIPVLTPLSRIVEDNGITHGVYWESKELLQALSSLPVPSS